MSRLALLLLVVACSSKSEPAATPPPPSPPVPTTPAPEAFWTSLPELPPGTFDLWVHAQALDATPVEQQWAWAAGRLCSEHDPFLIATPGRDDHVREGIACGRAVIEHVPGQLRSFTMEVNRPARDFTSPVFAVRTTLAIEDVEPLVVGFRKETLGTATVLCRTFDPSPLTCAERRNAYDKAIAIVDGYLLGGTYAALADLLQWSDRERLLALLPDLGARAGLDVDFLPRGTTWMLGPRRFLPFSREEATPLAAAIQRHARTVIVDDAWGLGRFSIGLVPRCSTKDCPERAELAAALRAYQQAWAPHAPARLAALFDEAGPDGQCARPIELAMVEAASKASIAVTSIVELRVTTDQRRAPGCGVDDKRAAAAVARVRAAL
jgi:hypothetical protein